MTMQEVIDKINLIKEGYVNGTVEPDELPEYLNDLIRDMKGSIEAFVFEDDDHYDTFEETDFSKLDFE